MTPNVHHLPLKIVHSFPYAPDAPESEKRRVVTDSLLYLRERGFGGIVTNVSFRDYLQNTEEWRMFTYAADECERLGLRLWLYDEHGYPSGGARDLTIAENPDFEAVGVVMVKEMLAAGEEKTIPLPRGHEHFLHAAVYACGENGNPLPDGEGGYPALCTADCRYSTEAVTLKNPLPQPAVALAFVRKRLYEGTHCVHNVHEARRYIDLTNCDAVAAFLRNTYDRYAAAIPTHMTAGAGNPRPRVGQVEAVFTDEPSFMGCYINKDLVPSTVRDPYDTDMPLYTVLSCGRDVENAFSSRYGYDLLPELVSIFLGESDRAHAIRSDYHTLLSDLYEDSFFSQISDWCARHRVSFSGHLLLEDDIRYHTVFEGNYFSLLRHMHVPGIDMLQSIPSVVRQYAITPKLVSSIAHLYGRPHVMSEVSAHAQGGNVTRDQMYASLAIQYALGVDLFTYYYSENFMDAPTYARYNHALGRIDAVMSSEDVASPARHVADALVYYPIETMQLHHRPSDAQYGSYTEAENRCHTSLMGLIDKLLDSQIDFDFVDGGTLDHLKIEDGVLVSASGERYAALILPEMEITPAMAQRFERLTANGVTILTHDAPLADALADRPLVTSTPVAGLVRLVRDTDHGRACLLVNTTEQPLAFSATIRGMATPTFYDPMTDTTLPCEFTEVDGGHAFSVTLAPMQSLIVREN